MVFNLYSLHKICIPLLCSWSGKTPMSPNRILNVDLISYLLKEAEFILEIFENKNLFQILD